MENLLNDAPLEELAPHASRGQVRAKSLLQSLMHHQQTKSTLLRQNLVMRANFPSSADGTFVILQLGSDAKEVAIYKEILCDISPVFRKLMGGPPKSRVHKLPKTDPTTFSEFKHWIDEDNLTIFTKSTSRDYEAIIHTRRSIMKAIDLYKLAETYKIPKLMDIIITELITAYRD